MQRPPNRDCPRHPDTMVLATATSSGVTVGRYTHLAIGEQEDIMLMRREGRGVREIAMAIGRDRSTVSRELRRNSRGCPYRTSTVQGRYEGRRGAVPQAAAPGRTRDSGSPGRGSSRVAGRPSSSRAGFALEARTRGGGATINREIHSGRLDRLIEGRRASARLRRGGRRRRPKK